MPSSQSQTELAAAVRGGVLEYLVGRLESRELPPLVPARAWDEGLSDEISGRSPEVLLGGADRVADPELARAVQAGLLLWNDELDASHTIAQGLPGISGSYWHALMHRREPDYSNSQYWFARVDEHPIFPDLRQAALAVGATSRAESVQAQRRAIETVVEWDPCRFVSACEAVARRPDADLEAYLRQVQLTEIRLLLLYCLRRARR